MTSKRTATTELNQENWNEEHEPEEAGTFIKASDDVLVKRVVKRAKRRLQASDDSHTRSAFGTFTGFKTATSPTTDSPFSFLANSCSPEVAPKTQIVINKPTPSNGASKGNENGTNKKAKSEVQATSTTTASKKSTSGQEDESIFKKSSAYFAKLKGLNESVAQWIKTHVDANPFCILTPIFKDYERYLKEIESKHGSETEKAIHTAEQSGPASDNKESSDTEKQLESSPFGGAILKSPPISSNWKPEKSIFSNISSGSTFIFGKSEHTMDGSKSVFSNTPQATDAQKSVFATAEHKPATKNIFGNVSSDKNPFLSKAPTVPDIKADDQDSKSDSKSTSSSFGTTNTFCFGQSSTTSNTTGFSFGSAKPFAFGAQAVKAQESEDKPQNEGKDEDEDEPPKTDIKPITEEGAIYEQRCKVYVKKDGDFTDRGVGILFLKPTPNDKTQLIVRAETSLGNLLLNTLLTESIPTKRMNKNTIMLVCLPKPESTPPPVPVLLRVKTEEDADALLNALNKHKK
ncbi:nuclear pore complex protein Nup50 isoform X2 [Andrena cerasifolii]|uniref:nuclear pore complex protein Nup50 isoform X2 n=1 Tax=Andrena cerasifolii TaxID=2819439 RepID=UPI004037CBF5